MTTNDSRSTVPEYQGLSLLDVLEILRSRKRFIVGIPMLLMSAAAIVGFFVLRPGWDATAVVQIGQVWEGSFAGGPVPIESPSKAVERIRFKPFQTAVLSSLGIPQDEGNPENLRFTESLGVRAISGTDLIEIQIRGFAPEQAKAWAESIVHQLKKSHDRIYDPAIVRIKQQLEHVDHQIKVAETAKQELLATSVLKAQIDPGTRFSENLVLANLLLRKNEEVAELKTRKLTLEEQLNPARSYPTSLLDSVYVSNRPSYPRKALLLLAAACLGLILGIVFALVPSVIRKMRSTT